MASVSIIIPLYNKAPYVVKALESVKAQTFTNYECIIINDGSTDNSAQIVTDWISDHFATSPSGPFRLLTQANAGVSSARNHGISLAQGDFLAFLDADDWWCETYLEEMMQLVEEYPDAGIYGCDYYRVKNGKLLVYPKNAEGYINYFQVYAKSGAMPLHPDGVLVPRYVIEELRGKSEEHQLGEWFQSRIKMGEDFLFFMKIVTRYKVAYLDKQLIYFNQDADATWRATSKLHKPEQHMLWNVKEFDECIANSDRCAYEEYKEMMDFLRVFSLEIYYRSREYHEAAVELLNQVDWEKGLRSENERLRKLYQNAYKWSHTAPWILRARYKMMHTLSMLKQKLKIRLQ